MIGLVISGTSFNEEYFSPSIYHKFDNGKSVLETTIRHCLDSALVQRVVVTMPQDQSRTALELDKRGRFGSASMQFYDKGDALDILYYAALTHTFSHVVRINANQLLLPGWGINNVVIEYMKAGGNDFYRTLNSPGFDVQIMPFWKLAQEFVEREKDRNKITDVWNTVKSEFVFSRSFEFNSSEHELFDSILHTVSLGYDVDQVIEDYLNGDKQETSEEQ